VVTKEAALAAAATLVALAFGLCTLDRFLARRRRHEGAWTLSLLFFTIASAALWLAAAKGWDPALFRVFYLFGAILNVPWLALGTVYLLRGRRAGDIGAGLLALVSAFAAGVMTVAPLRGPIARGGLPQGSDVFAPLPRILAAVCSGGGAVVIVVGAVVSAWRLWRGRARSRTTSGPVADPGRLAVGNVLIAAGTLILSASGTLNARLGALTAFAVTLLVGISVLFVGFLVATGATSGRAVQVAPSAEEPAQDLARQALG
jgi:hypothetical protein